MYLLVIITRQEDKTYDFLKLLPTVGVRGATVIEGRGMGKILRDRETIFTSIEQILSASIDLTGQLNEAFRHPDVGDVRRPDLVRAGHLEVSQEMRVFLRVLAWSAQFRAGIDRPKTQLAH